MRTRIKFCGCTTVADAAAAVACGVDAVGFILASGSPRRVDLTTARAIARALPPAVERVAVVVDPSDDEVAALRAQGFVPQFCGDESAAFCEATASRATGGVTTAQAWGPYAKVLHVAPDATPRAVLAQADGWSAYGGLWMFDTLVAGGARGGTGRRFSWELARLAAGTRPFAVSGGLDPSNAGACVRAVRPFAVDVRSGIETGGVKDLDKMRAFVRAVKEADAEA